MDLAFELHGARVRVCGTGPGASAAVGAALPAGARVVDGGPVDQTFRVALGAERSGDRSAHRVYCGPALLAECPGRPELVRELTSRLEFAVGEHAAERVYVHAGVVGVDGRAVVIPGRSLSGKTTLVAALVRAGATYYSDEFAVVDAAGQVWPHARPLSIRPPGTTGPGVDVPIDRLGGTAGTGPIPMGTVVATRHEAGGAWQPAERGAVAGLFCLLDNAIVAQTKPDLALRVLARAVTSACVLDGPRGDADDTARRLLERIGQRSA